MRELFQAIEAALKNADRLVDDARWLLDVERFPSAHALSILAQEEYAKAFLLYLIQIEAIPWNSEVRRTITNHTCKQLLALIMDHLEPEWDEFLRRMKNKYEFKSYFPPHVADALHIIRYEKVPRRGQWAWIDDDDPPCDPKPRKIANGQVDKEKQDALYIRIGKTGHVISTPFRITAEEAKRELEKAERVGRVIGQDEGLLKGPNSIEFEIVAETFKVLFGIKSIEDYNRNWWL